jgi:hypothetical protein
MRERGRRKCVILLSQGLLYTTTLFKRAREDVRNYGSLVGTIVPKGLGSLRTKNYTGCGNALQGVVKGSREVQN